MAKKEQEIEQTVNPKELIERRLKQLREQELPQAIAGVNAIQGAIQLCEQLLLELNGKTETKPNGE